jgi:Whirly transcription factor
VPFGKWKDTALKITGHANTFCLRVFMNHVEVMTHSKNLTMNDQSLEVAPTSERAVEYAIYKPNARGSGGVVRFGLNRAKACLFVDATNQSGEKQFDWENKITMKWTLSDLGTVLATLQGRMPQAKLFHQSERANSAFELTRQEDPDRAPYLLLISRQNAADKSLRKVMLPLSHGEAAVLETALQTAIARLLNW